MIHRLSILIVCLLSLYVRALPQRYIIYPKLGLSPQDTQQLTEKINKLAGTQENVYISTWGSAIRFWLADLTITACKELFEDKRVFDIHVEMVFEPFTENEISEKNSTYLFTPTSEVTPSNLSASEENISYLTQKEPIAAELRALSQPYGSDSISRYPNYVYPVGGRRSYIYHVELGINQEHIDFRGRPIEWLFTGLAIRERVNTQTEAAIGNGHSTCTASKAVGKLYGASKSATLVVVKMPYYGEGSALDALGVVMDDINAKHRQATSVVSISWGSKEAVDDTILSRGTLYEMDTTFNEFIRLGVVIVCAAGNAAEKRTVHGGSRLYVDTVPPVLKNIIRSKKFLVVGNSDINGARHPTSQLITPPQVGSQVYAPGVEMKCASSTSSTEIKTDTGTSYSAPLVAGVIADLLSTEQYVPGRPFWWKRPGGQNVIWNLVTEADNPPVFASGNATLVNYTSSILTTTDLDTNGLDNEQLEQLDLSTN